MRSHPGAGPFRLGPDAGPRVLLLHGLTGAPSELWSLGVGLAAVGFRVEAPLWPGHGRTPEALAAVSAAELLESAFAAAEGDGRPLHAAIGLSMGALLALGVAARLQPERLVLLSPAAVMHGGSALYDLLGRVPWPRTGLLLSKERRGATRIGALAPAVAGARTSAGQSALQAPEPQGWDGRYDRIPLHWSHELRQIRLQARAAAAQVCSPTLILHGLADLTASPAGALVAAGWLQATEVRVRFFAASPHVMPLGPERGAVADEVALFLGAAALAAQAPAKTA